MDLHLKAENYFWLGLIDVAASEKLAQNRFKTGFEIQGIFTRHPEQ